VNDELAELVRELKARGVTANHGRLFTAFLRREIGKLIEDFDVETERREISGRLLAKVILEGGTIGAPTTESTVPYHGQRSHDRARWGWLCEEHPEYGDEAVIRACNEVEAEGQKVTPGAVKLKLGRPRLNDETDPLTAEDYTAPRKQLQRVA
jgi:hypothetical protein